MSWEAPPRWSSFDVVRANCARIGLPMPLFATMFNPPSGSGAGALMNYGSVPFRGNAITDVTYVARQYSGVQLGTDVSNINRLTFDTAQAASAGAFIPRARNGLSVLVVHTPLRQSAGADVSPLSVWNTGGHAESSFLLLTNYTVGPTDYFPGFAYQVTTAVQNTTHTPTWTVGTRELLCGTRDQGVIEIFRNQSRVTRTTGLSTGLINNATPHYLRIGGINTGSGFNTNGHFEMAMIFEVALTLRQWQQFAIDPYYAFRPMEQNGLSVYDWPTASLLEGTGSGGGGGPGNPEKGAAFLSI